MIRPVYRLFAMALVGLFVGGCAIGRVGTLLAKVTPARGAWVIDIYAIGTHVRPTDDPGVTIGFARHSYVFATDEISMPRSGLHRFVLPALPYGKAVLRHLETLGIDARLSGPEPGVTVGFQALTVSRPMAPEENAFRMFTYSPDTPRLTCLTTDWGRRC